MMAYVSERGGMALRPAPSGGLSAPPNAFYELDPDYSLENSLDGLEVLEVEPGEVPAEFQRIFAAVAERDAGDGTPNGATIAAMEEARSMSSSRLGAGNKSASARRRRKK